MARKIVLAAILIIAVVIGLGLIGSYPSGVSGLAFV